MSHLFSLIGRQIHNVPYHHLLYGFPPIGLEAKRRAGLAQTPERKDTVADQDTLSLRAASAVGCN